MTGHASTSLVAMLERGLDLAFGDDPEETITFDPRIAPEDRTGQVLDTDPEETA